MPLSPEQAAHLNRQARRRAERAAEEMSFGKVSSEDYLKKLRAKRRPGRPFEVEEIPAAVEIEEEDDDPAVPASRHYSTNTKRSSAPPREAMSPRPSRGSNPHRVPTTSKTRQPSIKPTTRSSTRASVSSRTSLKERPKSRNDLLKVAQQPSTTTLGSTRLSSASIASRSRSTLSLIKPKKSVRRAKSVAAIPSKLDSVEDEPVRTKHHSKHTRSQSAQTIISPDSTLPHGTLTKRSSLRSLKDKIRRVASAFELRSASDEKSTKGDITLQHNKSTRSLLRYSATRIRRRHLDTVNEET